MLSRFKARTHAKEREGKSRGSLVVPHVQTKTEIREALERFGIRPRKRHGQHFLIDGNLMRRLADAAELRREDLILEIGPGTGGLTDLLLGSAGLVVAVEIDPAMQAILRERFAGQAGFRLIAGDILAGKHRLSAEVLGVLGEGAATGRTLKLVANLPYHAATPALANLLTCATPPSLLVFTVQKEVADRLTARAGSKDYGPLSVLFQTVCDLRVVAQVPASAFWPEPQVASTMLRCRYHPPIIGNGITLAGLMRVVHGGFTHRRKTLRHSLRRFVPQAGFDRVETAFDLDRRPEQLSVGEWVSLAELVEPDARIGHP